MTNKSSSPDIQGLWQSQPPSVSPEDFRRKIQKFEHRIFRRNIREYAGGIFVVIASIFCEWKLSAPLFRIGLGLAIVGALYVMFQLHRRASVRPMPGDLGSSTCVEFHRQTLERQRDALRGVGSWYLLPLAPGLLVILIGTAINQWTAHPVHLGHFIMSYSILTGVIGAVFLAVWKLNQRGADRLQVQIDEMIALRGHTDSAEHLC